MILSVLEEQVEQLGLNEQRVFASNKNKGDV